MSTEESNLLRQVLAELVELRALVKPTAEAKLSLTREEAMALAGYEPDEVGAWFIFCSRSRLKPYRRKHYRRQDVVEAVARAALPRKKTQKKAA